MGNVKGTVWGDLMIVIIEFEFSLDFFLNGNVALYRLFRGEDSFIS